jgi:putative sigma-54 modulation protein
MELTTHVEYVDRKSKVGLHIPNVDETRIDLSYVKSARSATDRQVAQITIMGVALSCGWKAR